MAKKYFTAEAAQAKLPEIKKSIAKLQGLKRAIGSILSVRANPDEIGYDDFLEMSTKLNKDYHKLSYEFYNEMENFERIGCLLKDLEQGLVDFYCKFEGRDIFLCWRLGESKIRAWHEIDEGFAGRRGIISLEQ
ncbi:DUF2203 domain-containing protein [Candidatus Woesearchaeota archaeon]|nr:DUF2203 domain-containing protein [Candidatus Woesearchaeota archaeon]